MSVSKPDDAIFYPSPFMQFLGLQIDSMKDGTSQLRLPLHPQLMNKGGFVHGGVLASLIDAAAALAASSVLNPHEFVVTSDLNIAYLRSWSSDEIACDCRLTWRGSTLIRAEANVTAAGEVLAKGFVSLLVRTYRKGSEASLE